GCRVKAGLADACPRAGAAVQPGLEPEPRGAGLLVRGDGPRPERAARVKILARGPLQAVALEIAHAAVVEARVARDVLHGPLARHAPALLADDDGELAFVVELDRFARPHDRLQMADEAVREAHEDHGILGPLAAHLLDVRQVVDADAEEFRGRIGDRGAEADVGEREIRRKALQAPQQVQRARGQHVPEPCELASQAGARVDYAVAGDDAEAVASVDREADQAHDGQPCGGAASCARLRTASSSPRTRCPDSPSRRTDTVSSATSLRPTARITGIFASECSRTL